MDLVNNSLFQDRGILDNSRFDLKYIHSFQDHLDTLSIITERPKALNFMFPYFTILNQSVLPA